MRSRYAAFALGEVDYLWRTLDPEHPDRARPEAEVLAQMRIVCRTLRCLRLRVLDSDLNGETARVLFHAELYERGKERSFCELSVFRRHGESWRYFSGTERAVPASDPSLPTLTIATFDR